MTNNMAQQVSHYRSRDQTSNRICIIYINKNIKKGIENIASPNYHSQASCDLSIIMLMLMMMVISLASIGFTKADSLKTA